MIRGCDGDGPSEKMSTDVNRRQPELVTPLLCHLALLASRHLLLIPDPSRLLTLATARHLRSSGCRHDTLWSEVQSTTKLHECQKSSRTSHSGSGCCQHHAGHCMCNWGLSPPAIHLRGIDLAPPIAAARTAGHFMRNGCFYFWAAQHCTGCWGKDGHSMGTTISSQTSIRWYTA